MISVRVDFNNVDRAGRVWSTQRRASGEVVVGARVLAIDPTEGDEGTEAVVAAIDDSGRIWLDFEAASLIAKPAGHDVANVHNLITYVTAASVRTRNAGIRVIPRNGQFDGWHRAADSVEITVVPNKANPYRVRSSRSVSAAR